MIRSAYKVVGPNYRSVGNTAGIDAWLGDGMPGPLAALNLTYTIGTQVTPDPDLERTVKDAHVTKRNNDGSPLAGPFAVPWLGLDASSGIWIGGRLSLLVRFFASVKNARWVQLQYDSATDVLGALDDETRLSTAYVLAEVTLQEVIDNWGA
jgi:hypothetical protein